MIYFSMIFFSHKTFQADDTVEVRDTAFISSAAKRPQSDPNLSYRSPVKPSCWYALLQTPN